MTSKIFQCESQITPADKSDSGDVVILPQINLPSFDANISDFVIQILKYFYFLLTYLSSLPCKFKFPFMFYFSVVIIITYFVVILCTNTICLI